MPVSWTADLDRRLLLLVLELVNVDAKKIAQRWDEKHGDDGGSQPTARAISERIYKLKHLAGGMKGEKAMGETPSALQPKKMTAPKTPLLTRKRKKPTPVGELEPDNEVMSAEDESSTKRTKSGRRSKTLQKHRKAVTAGHSAGEVDDISTFPTSTSTIGQGYDVNRTSNGAHEHGFQIGGMSDIFNFDPST